MTTQCIHYIPHGSRSERVHLDTAGTFRNRYPGGTVKIDDQDATITLIHGIVDPPLTPAEVAAQLHAIGVDGGAVHVGVVAPFKPKSAPNNPFLAVRGLVPGALQ